MDNENSKAKHDKGKIFIKKEAFRNMLTHVLRFGNKALEQSIEVMGICLGNYKAAEEIVIIENAVPIIHGDKVEIGFDKEIFDLFTEIDNKYSSNLIGYYHSHPSWGLYLSESDVSNLKYFQGEKNPHGFAIVFDHTLMGKNKNLGFKIYRLDDYSKAEKYHTVPFEVEIPSSLEYYRWVQKFSEDAQKKDPILIKEINEFLEKPPGELGEIPISEEDLVRDEQITGRLQLESIISGFQQGTESFSQDITDIIKNQIGVWIDDIDKGSSKGSEYIINALSKMKGAISSGILKIDNWFKRTLDETVYQFKNSVSTYVDRRVHVNKELTEQISKLEDELIGELKTIVDTNLGKIKGELETLEDNLAQKVEESMKMNLHIEELSNIQKSIITKTDDQMKLFTEDIEKKIETSINPLKTNIDEKIEKLSTELQPFKDYNEEIKILLEKLQKIITGFKNLS